MLVVSLCGDKMRKYTCPVCHGHKIETTCMGVLGEQPDFNRAMCHDCTWTGVAENCYNYEDFKPETLLELERTATFAPSPQEIPPGLPTGSLWRLGNRCKCGRDLFVSVGCVVWCAGGQKKLGSSCGFILGGG